MLATKDSYNSSQLDLNAGFFPRFSNCRVRRNLERLYDAARTCPLAILGVSH